MIYMLSVYEYYFQNEFVGKVRASDGKVKIMYTFKTYINRQHIDRYCIKWL